MLLIVVVITAVIFTMIIASIVIISLFTTKQYITVLALTFIVIVVFVAVILIIATILTKDSGINDHSHNYCGFWGPSSLIISGIWSLWDTVPARPVYTAEEISAMLVKVLLSGRTSGPEVSGEFRGAGVRADLPKLFPPKCQSRLQETLKP